MSASDNTDRLMNDLFNVITERFVDGIFDEVVTVHWVEAFGGFPVLVKEEKVNWMRDGF